MRPLVRVLIKQINLNNYRELEEAIKDDWIIIQYDIRKDVVDDKGFLINVVNVRLSKEIVDYEEYVGELLNDFMF